MSRSLKSYWVNRVEVSVADRKRLALFVREELKYYNTLVSGLSGPIRSMPETFVKSASYENLFGVVAEQGRGLRTLKAEALPAAFAPFKNVLFDETGKMLLDDRTLYLADVIATPATLDRTVRRQMATAIMRECRRQSKALNEGTQSDGGMPTIIETLIPIDPSGKRHVQIPRAAIKVTESGDEVTLKLPYFVGEVTVPKPSATWNYVYVRAGHDGEITVDLAFEEAPYALRKVDRAPQRPGMKVEAAPVRRHF